MFTINDDNHLLFSNLHLAAMEQDGKVTIKYGNETFKVELTDLDADAKLTVKSAFGVDNIDGRKNDIVLNGKTIEQTSNNGRQYIAVILEADGQEILDESQVIYTIDKNGNMGMTTPESSKIEGSKYTYGLYIKYKNGDYTATDKGDYTTSKTLIVPGKGNIELTFKLHAEEYEAE